MVALAVLAYYLIVVFLVLVVVFPALRARFATVFVGVAGSGASKVLRKGLIISSFVRSLWGGLGGGCISFFRYVRRHPGGAGVAFFVVVAPTFMALSLHGPAVFDYSDQQRGADRQIAVLLEGEQLVPPPPLPPEVFTTKEVEMVRPDVAGASRNWGALDQSFVQRLLVVYKIMKERYGYDMVLVEGYRSPERQARLFASGGHVTQAAANMSYHQYGLAADSAFFRDGKIVISERDSWAMRGYQLYGEVAEQVGLTWGGRWKMQDYGHVELRKSGVLGRNTVQ